jgi:hypothetical protein
MWRRVVTADAVGRRLELPYTSDQHWRRCNNATKQAPSKTTKHTKTNSPDLLHCRLLLCLRIKRLLLNLAIRGKVGLANLIVAQETITLSIMASSLNNLVKATSKDQVARFFNACYRYRHDAVQVGVCLGVDIYIATSIWPPSALQAALHSPDFGLDATGRGAVLHFHFEFVCTQQSHVSAYRSLHSKASSFLTRHCTTRQSSPRLTKSWL